VFGGWSLEFGGWEMGNGLVVEEKLEDGRWGLDIDEELECRIWLFAIDKELEFETIRLKWFFGLLRGFLRKVVLLWFVMLVFMIVVMIIHFLDRVSIA